MPIGLQRLKDPHLLLGRQLRKYGGVLDLDGQFVLGEPLQFLACQSVHRIDAQPAADGHGHASLVSGKYPDAHMKSLQFADGSGSSLLGRIEKGQIAQQDKVPLVFSLQLRCVQRFIGYGQHLHAILQHFVHDGVNAGKSVSLHGLPLSPVFHKAAPAAHLVHTALDDKQILLFSLHQNAGKLPLVIKGQLIQLWVLLRPPLKIPAAPRHLPALQNCGIQMVSHASVVKAVEIGKVQHLLALVAQDIHVIFQ